MNSNIITNPDHFVKFPTAFNTVDIICIRDGKILLGQKKEDGNLRRFPGGFVDPEDVSIEEAAYREFFEETGCHATDLRYAFNMRIDDSRYRDTPHSMITHVFMCGRFVGTPTAFDDLDKLEEFEFNTDGSYLIPRRPYNSIGKLIPNHEILMKRAIKERDIYRLTR